MAFWLWRDAITSLLLMACTWSRQCIVGRTWALLSHLLFSTLGVSRSCGNGRVEAPSLQPLRLGWASFPGGIQLVKWFFTAPKHMDTLLRLQMAHPALWYTPASKWNCYIHALAGHIFTTPDIHDRNLDFFSGLQERGWVLQRVRDHEDFVRDLVNDIYNIDGDGRAALAMRNRLHFFGRPAQIELD